MADIVGIKPHTSWNNIVNANVSLQTVIAAGLGSFNFGYANNVIAGTLAQPTFIAKFLSSSDNSARVDGIIGCFLAGAVVGAIIQSPISSNWGPAICFILGNALEAGATHIAMYIVGRAIAGVAGGMTISNCPVYINEISPPHTRGLLVGLQGVCIVWAYIIGSSLALGFSFVTEDYQRRLNYIVAVFFGLNLLVSLFFLPESPRWLVEMGREDEAAVILERLHRSKSDPNGTIKAQTALERSLPCGYLHILSKPSLRMRFICTALVWTMGQSTGINVIATLTPVLFASLGFDTTLQLGLSIVWTACLQVGCFINIYLLDRVGRKNLLVVGGIGCVILLSIEAALEKYYLASNYTPGINACVAIYFTFATWFTATIECTGYVYGSEIWPTHLRSHGATITYVAFFLNALAYSTPASTAFTNISWKYYMVFVSVTVPCVIAIIFLFPETKGLTLEEISGKFNDLVEITFDDALAHDLEEEKSERVPKGGDQSTVQSV
ncbi:general substrate transporter [Xylogone sp. PMI_703]|nr:general substrate transporter [Xylogone sp. PMI_703]